jgi:uncharacterized protein YggU (UPF0235/DUF167 family)
MADGTLKLRVSAAAEDGRANRAVVELLAAVLGVREQAVSVIRGGRSRSKTVEVQGLDDRTLAARIETALGAAGTAERSTRRQGGG